MSIWIELDQSLQAVQAVFDYISCCIKSDQHWYSFLVRSRATVQRSEFLAVFESVLLVCHHGIHLALPWCGAAVLIAVSRVLLLLVLPVAPHESSPSASNNSGNNNRHSLSQWTQRRTRWDHGGLS